MTENQKHLAYKISIVINCSQLGSENRHSICYRLDQCEENSQMKITQSQSAIGNFKA